MRLFLAILLAGVTASAGSAQTTFFQSASSGTTIQTSTVTIGYMFKVGSNPVSVTSLGTLDFGGNGLVGSVDIGLWTANGSQPLTTVTIPSGTTAPLRGANNFPNNSGFRYADLATSVTLDPNQLYIIGQLAHGADPAMYHMSGLQTSVDLTLFDPMSSASGTTLSKPVNLLGSDFAGYIGPNIQYVVSPVPEPAMLLGVGAAGLGALRVWRRRRNRSNAGVPFSTE